MTRDEAYTSLGLLGHSGALEDRLIEYLGGGSSLEDLVFSVDPTAGSVDNWLIKQTSLTGSTSWDDTLIWDDTNTWNDTQGPL